MEKRAYALDALRGYAILTMVLSATVAFGILPGWMYHAQEPPPFHRFDPSVYGITWVDLVFPFFLFALGAAFPFSIGKRVEAGVSRLRLAGDAFLRGLQLTFFAIYIQHVYPWEYSSPGPASWWVALGGFSLMFPMFMRLPRRIPGWLRLFVKAGAFTAGFLLVLCVQHAGGQRFSPGYSNIIILVLANMAMFGSWIYLLTMGHMLARVAVLPFLLAVFLGSSVEGSWVKAFYDYTPLPWMYRFYYLKYLFIVIPGSIAGEYIKSWMQEKEGKESHPGHRPVLIAGLAVGMIVCNLYCLYTRCLLLNLGLTGVAVVAGIRLLRKTGNGYGTLWRKLFRAGGYLLLLGLFFEAYEGGIRKDPSTYSYYLVTSGLAFLALLFFSIVCDYYKMRKATGFLVLAGQNPMIAYAVPDLVVMPLLGLAGLMPVLTVAEQSAVTGFLRGIVLTAFVAGITVCFTKLRWYWRT